MKRAALIKQLRELARKHGIEFEFERHGGEHDQWRFGSGTPIAFPRHREVAELTARRILRDARRRIEDR